MITFKQFLSESRYAPLYHGTTLAKLNQILYDNVLNVGSSYGKENHPFGDSYGRQVSLTRSLAFAKQWGKPADGMRVAIEFNVDRLRSRYKITPFNFFGTKVMGKRTSARAPAPSDKDVFDIYNQREEVVGKSIKDLDQYVEKIWIWGLSNKERLINNYPEVGDHPLLYDGDKKRWINK